MNRHLYLVYGRLGLWACLWSLIFLAGNKAVFEQPLLLKMEEKLRKCRRFIHLFQLSLEKVKK